MKNSKITNSLLIICIQLWILTK